ncbi:hypothetical protein RFI_19333 [Reticulomyxa filosa]|uniref:Uncharacterized protein n=1 Tax=Reticulomyxa filosa TaxID=46433 RepID=X6MY16_RETFI|nr:hypothetical protein RFI_19333 [Reticulomyxa filosa]|eukprot:ETO17970.1 hypothetical protein RFI_19333 [Reticulomyxa filosa]
MFLSNISGWKSSGNCRPFIIINNKRIGDMDKFRLSSDSAVLVDSSFESEVPWFFESLDIAPELKTEAMFHLLIDSFVLIDLALKIDMPLPLLVKNWKKDTNIQTWQAQRSTLRHILEKSKALDEMQYRSAPLQINSGIQNTIKYKGVQWNKDLVELIFSNLRLGFHSCETLYNNSNQQEIFEIVKDPKIHAFLELKKTWHCLTTSGVREGLIQQLKNSPKKIQQKIQQDIIKNLLPYCNNSRTPKTVFSFIFVVKNVRLCKA